MAKSGRSIHGADASPTYWRLLRQVRFPLHYVPELGFCSAIGKIRFATLPPTVPGVGGGTGICTFTGFGSGAWTRSLSRAQSVDVALPIAPGRVSHGLNPKYTGPVYTMSSGDGEKKLLGLTWGRPDFPSAAAVPLTRVPRVSTHVEAMSGALPWTLWNVVTSFLF